MSLEKFSKIANPDNDRHQLFLIFLKVLIEEKKQSTNKGEKHLEKDN